MSRQKNFSTKRSIETYLRGLDKIDFEADHLESYFVPNLGNSTIPHENKGKINPNSILKRRLEYFNELKKEGVCNICKLKKELVIDHCHSSRKIRGALCQNCNHGLGKFMDDVALLERAIEYLKKDYSSSLDYYNLK